MEKIAYSITHSPSIYNVPGTEVLALQNNELNYYDVIDLESSHMVCCRINDAPHWHHRPANH